MGICVSDIRGGRMAARRCGAARGEIEGWTGIGRAEPTGCRAQRLLAGYQAAADVI